jgi:hypothetical protein
VLGGIVANFCKYLTTTCTQFHLIQLEYIVVTLEYLGVTNILRFQAGFVKNYKDLQLRPSQFQVHEN